MRTSLNERFGGTRNFIEVYQKSINHEAFNEKCQKKLLRNEKDEYLCTRWYIVMAIIVC